MLPSARWYRRRCVATHQMRVVLVLAMWAPAVPVAAQVTIEGGRSSNDLSLYAWTITNNTSKPIVSFQIPYYQVRAIVEHEGWTCEVTDQPEVAGKERQRIVLFKVRSPSSAIFPGGTGVLNLRASVTKSAPGIGVATVGFANGTTETVSNVEIPWEFSWLQRHTLLISFGAIFAVFLLVQIVRSRGKKESDTDQSPIPTD